MNHADEKLLANSSWMVNTNETEHAERFLEFEQLKLLVIMITGRNIATDQIRSDQLVEPVDKTDCRSVSLW